MDSAAARETLTQLAEYTKDTARFLGVPYSQNGRNSYGPFPKGKPNGAIMHYTASNAAYSKKRKYGRYPTMRRRFARGAKQGVGVHVIVWDKPIERFADFQAKYDLLKDMPTEIAFMGDDLAFWHAGSANRWAYGIEIRNVGKVTSDSRGNLFWGRNRYHGRPPIKVGQSWWEPYTYAQMAGTLWVNRLLCAANPVEPQRFLGHTHVSNTRIDPGPHFPIHEMRRFSIDEQDVPLGEVRFLKEFSDDPGLEEREEPEVSEEMLHKGLYRHDWDGFAKDDWDGQDLPPVTPPTTDKAQVYRDLNSLGYYVTEETYDDTVAIFRLRWKERRPGGRGWRNMLKAEGGMDEKARRLLGVMVKQWDNI